MDISGQNDSIPSNDTSIDIRNGELYVCVWYDWRMTSINGCEKFIGRFLSVIVILWGGRHSRGILFEIDIMSRICDTYWRSDTCFIHLRKMPNVHIDHNLLICTESFVCMNKIYKYDRFRLEFGSVCCYAHSFEECFSWYNPKSCTASTFITKIHQIRSLSSSRVIFGIYIQK